MATDVAEKAEPSSTEKALTTVRTMLEAPKMKAQLQAALPRQISADKMIRLAMTSIQKNPKLLECHPITLIGAVVQCAQLGLEPDDGTGKAYLIPFFNNKKGRTEAQFMAGYRGLVDLVRRSGMVKKFVARAVKEGDQFSYQFGLNEELNHVPSDAPDRMKKPITHVYAIAWFKDSDEPQWDVMTKAEVDAVRARAKSKDNGPWVTDYDEMAKKTVVRRICKMLPSSPEDKFHQAVALDERAEVGLPQDLGILADPTETGTPNAEEPAKGPQRASDVAPALATPPKAISADQVKAIETSMKSHQVPPHAMDEYLAKTIGVKAIKDIPVERYTEVLKWLANEPEIPFGN
jgi:recombination protein RecT